MALAAARTALPLWVQVRFHTKTDEYFGINNDGFYTNNDDCVDRDLPRPRSRPTVTQNLSRSPFENNPKEIFHLPLPQADLRLIDSILKQAATWYYQGDVLIVLRCRHGDLRDESVSSANTRKTRFSLVGLGLCWPCLHFSWWKTSYFGWHHY